MNNALVATLGGLWAMLLWGYGDYLVAKNSRQNNHPIEINAAFQLPGFVVIMALIFATHQHINSWHNIGVISAAGVMFTAAFIFFIRGLSSGAMGIVAPIAGIYPLFTILLTAIFLTLNFSGLQTFAMVVIVAGVIMMAYERRNKEITIRAQHYATAMALSAAFLWGVGNVVQNSVITRESWQIILGAINVSMLISGLVALYISPRDKFSAKLGRVLHNKTTLTAGAIYTMGSFGFYYSSVRVGSVLIPLVVSSTSPLVTAGLGAIYGRERLTLLKRAGAVVAVLGIILINLG